MIKNLLNICISFSIIAVFAFSSIAASAEKEIALPVLHTKTKTMAVFKNGLGFFIREGVVSPVDGWAVTEYVPNASLGSLWIGSLDKDAQLEEVIGFKEDIKKVIDAISLEELLESNIGRKVKITYGDNKIIEGIIKSAPETREPEKEDRTRIDNSRYIYDPRSQSKAASIVIIDTRRGRNGFKQKYHFKDRFSKRFFFQISG